MTVLFKTFDNVGSFNKLALGIVSEIDVRQRHYILDGKSIMALYSLDLSKPVEVTVNEVIPSERAQFETAVKNMGIVIG